MTVKNVKAHSDMVATEALMCRKRRGLISGAYTHTTQFHVEPKILVDVRNANSGQES